MESTLMELVRNNNDGTALFLHLAEGWQIIYPSPCGVRNCSRLVRIRIWAPLYNTFKILNRLLLTDRHIENFLFRFDFRVQKTG